MAEAQASQVGPSAKDMASGGRFVRSPYAFGGWIRGDGSGEFPPEPGRYTLYVQHACPWCHRVMIVRSLLGLEEFLPAIVADPIRDERGWAFRDGPGHTADKRSGFTYLSEAYLATDPAFVGRYTVPTIWDPQQRRIVSNRFDDMTIMMETELTAFHRSRLDLYPTELRPEIDALNARMYHMFNNGVYRAGFSTTQAAYEQAYDDVFAMLDEMEARLATSRYLVGNRLTEADVHAFPTLVRFDTVYALHFKCNKRRIVDYPNLWGYTRDLFQRPAFSGTTDFDHIKRHYYMTHGHINPTRIVPKGPELDWAAPHGRERLGPA
jgi:putative glutathione S-transferase